jgi:hypothetical protein
MHSLWTHPIPLQHFEQETYPFQLTIKALKKLNPGDTIELLCLDRNLYDFTDHHEENKIMSVSKFFDKAYQCKYTHINGLKGTIIFDDVDTIIPFEFHLEWKENRWFPLKDGLLKSDEHMQFPEEYENRSWDSFDNLTRIGWRGPMIMKKYYKYLPKVYRVDIDKLFVEINHILTDE